MTSNILFDAVKAHFTAEKQKAIATLTVYLQSPIGIGEHAGIIDEMIEQTRKIADAQGALDILEQTFEVKEQSVNE
jgi:methylaspartate ammonia-lyase